MGGIFFAANRDRVNVWKRGDRNYLHARPNAIAGATNFARDTRVHIHSAGFLPRDTWARVCSTNRPTRRPRRLARTW